MEKRKNTWIRTMEGCIVLVCLCCISLFYVWQHISIVRLGYQIRKNEISFDELLNEKARLQSLVSAIESPANIEKKIMSENMQLNMSNKNQVIRMKI
ncbi:MAG: hypothetical protein JW774_07520 [Candidatus Aureabacteria bacterium]|nr:hypothetical protein [Candidatus Auribacterota bacterium]